MVLSAEDAREIACMNNREFGNAVDSIMAKIKQEAQKGNFGMTYSVEIYRDDVLDAIRNHLVRMGYAVQWALRRGDNCSERIFNVSWA